MANPWDTHQGEIVERKSNPLEDKAVIEAVRKIPKLGLYDKWKHSRDTKKLVTEHMKEIAEIILESQKSLIHSKMEMASDLQKKEIFAYYQGEVGKLNVRIGEMSAKISHDLEQTLQRVARDIFVVRNRGKEDITALYEEGLIDDIEHKEEIERLKQRAEKRRAIMDQTIFDMLESNVKMLLRTTELIGKGNF